MKNESSRMISVGHKPARRLSVFLDSRGYIEDVTPEAARFLQRSRASLLHKPFASLVSQDYRAEWLAHFLAHLTLGRRGNIRLVLNTGTSAGAVEVLTAAAGNGVGRLLVTFAEKPRASAANLIEHIFDLVLTIDRNGTVSFTNRPLAHETPEQVIGRSFYGYLRPYDLKRFKTAIERVFASGTSTDFISEGLVSFPPGKHFRVRVKPLPIQSASIFSKALLDIHSAIIVISDVTDQYVAQERLQRMNQTGQRAARRASLYREEERRRLALELHDRVGQSLTALKIDLTLARRKINGPTGRSGRKALKSAESAVDDLIKLVRELSAELRPPLLDELGLVAALQFQMEMFQQRTGIRAIFKSHSEEIPTSFEIGVGVFRVFQEALTNIIRHANASKVAVELTVQRGWLVLTVADNGRGILEDEIYSPKSFGLIGMQERAQQLGGTTEFQRNPTRGTSIVMRTPLSDKRGGEDVPADNTIENIKRRPVKAN